MRRWMIGLACLLAAFVWGNGAGAQDAGAPGKFDYYVLALSWSPTYCATGAGRDDAEQCASGRRYGFVVHGLWPQYAAGGYPAQCVVPPPPVPAEVAQDILAVMPSHKLVEHEWLRHGTCQGGDPAHYFSTVKGAFASVHIPPVFAAPQAPLFATASQVEEAFTAANPGLTADKMAVMCRGRYGAEVRICLDRALKFMPCGDKVRDRCAGQVIFPAVR